MTVRCRRFHWDALARSQWADYPSESGKDPQQGDYDGSLHEAVCAFLSSLPPGRLVAVCEGTGSYGWAFVSVYYGGGP